MTLFHQRDAKWAKDKMGSADYEIDKHGCVITALCNIAAMKRGEGSMWTPHYLNKSLVNVKGYKDGNVYWDKAAAILNFKSIESMWYVSGTNNRKKLDFDKYFYIGRYQNGKTGHFTNILAETETQYLLFDVWYDDFRFIDKEKVNRIVRVAA